MDMLVLTALGLAGQRSHFFSLLGCHHKWLLPRSTWSWGVPSWVVTGWGNKPSMEWQGVVCRWPLCGKRPGIPFPLPAVRKPLAQPTLDLTYSSGNVWLFNQWSFFLHLHKHETPGWMSRHANSEKPPAIGDPTAYGWWPSEYCTLVRHRSFAGFVSMFPGGGT